MPQEVFFLARPAYRYAVELITAHDGDTYKFDVDLGFGSHLKIWVRLLEWGCPELKTNDGKLAQKIAEHALTQAKQILIETVKDEQTFYRWLARVYVDGQDIGEILHAAGLAEKR